MLENPNHVIIMPLLLLQGIVPPALLGEMFFYTHFAVFQALPKCLVPLTFDKTDLLLEVVRQSPFLVCSDSLHLLIDACQILAFQQPLRLQKS